MPQSLAQVYLHLVFSTKDRRPFLEDPILRGDLHRYLIGTCRNFDSPSLQIGGVADHIHILCRFGRNQSIAETIRELKRDSSKWIKEQRGGSATFSWQSGYGAFSISRGHVEKLIQYIANQEVHHRTESFQDEFRRLCEFYGLAIDERYAWD